MNHVNSSISAECDLVQQLIDGNEDAFCKIYSLYKERLLYFIVKFLKSKDVSEDVCQDIFLFIWQNRSYIDSRCSFSSFLFTIAKNRVLNILRHVDVEESLKEQILSLSINYSNDTQDRVSVNELKEILSAALGKLTDRQREVFAMSREKGMSNREIAAALNISIYTVSEHISAALTVIHHLLKKTYGQGCILLLLLLLRL